MVDAMVGAVADAMQCWAMLGCSTGGWYLRGKKGCTTFLREKKRMRPTLGLSLRVRTFSEAPTVPQRVEKLSFGKIRTLNPTT